MNFPWGRLFVGVEVGGVKLYAAWYGITVWVTGFMFFADKDWGLQSA
jgi:hypothetical protein